jgi:hypothetical protein
MKTEDAHMFRRPQNHRLASRVMIIIMCWLDVSIHVRKPSEKNQKTFFKYILERSELNIFLFASNNNNKMKNNK